MVVRHVVRSCGSFFSMLGFHIRNLLSTSFFLETAIFAPLSFALLKVLSSQGNMEMKSIIWCDSSISGLWATTTLAVGLIGYQRFQGVLQYLVSAALPLGFVMMPLVSSAAFIGVIGLPISLLVVYISGVDISISAFQIAGYALSIVACSASAMLLSAVFVLTRRATAYEPLILTPVWLLSGIVTPVGTLPVPLRILAFLHPLTPAVYISHLKTTSTSSVIFLVLFSLFLDALYIALAHVALSKVTTKVRISGTLDLS